MKPDSDWIRKKISYSGKTQTGLAKVLGLDKAQVSRLIDGKRRVQLDEVKPIADYLEVSVMEMLRVLGLRI
jgi:plasmid maintenance system antidote protein VapI